MKRLAIIVSFINVTALYAQPSSCPTQAPELYGIMLTTACDPCLAGQPVTFTLVPNNSPCQLDPYKCPSPYVIQACDTVAWSFGDGATMTVVGSPSATHTYATGNGYDVTVEVTNAKAPTASPRTFEVTIGNSSPTTITVSLPTPLSEASGSLLVNLTRSGNLGVPSAAEYRLSNWGGTQRLASTNGEVHFAAGDTQRVLSFPLLDNDTIFKGKSSYLFQLETEDGTLLAGLPKSPGYPSEVRGVVEVFDDEPRPRVRLHDLRIIEGDAGFTRATIKATLDTPSGLHSFFRGGIAGSDNDFYLGHNQASFTFIPGATTAEGTTVLINGDVDPEPDDALTFVLDTSLGSEDSPAIERGAATLTIVNDDIGFGQANFWMNVGESATLPVDLGTPLAAGAMLSFTPDLGNVVALTPSLNVGASTGTIKIDAIRGGDTLVTARVDSTNSVAKGTIDIHVFQPSILVANPTAVRLRVGEEATLRVSFAPAQPATTSVQVQPEKSGVVTVLNVLSYAPAGGEAVVKLRGLAPGKTSLNIFSLGQQHSTIVPVEVVPNSTRRRSARP